MSRRHFLAIAMTVVVLVGLLLVALMFTRSLSPSGNAKVIAAYQESGILEFAELKTGSETERNFHGSPIFVRKLNDNDYLILSLIPRFSNKSVVGCGIKRLYINSPGREDRPPNTYFIEPCRGVNYDIEGNVLEWSHHSALPMQRLQWKYVESSNNRIEIYP